MMHKSATLGKNNATAASTCPSALSLKTTPTGENRVHRAGNNRGAGDGVGIPADRTKRLQMRSARKFATRGVVHDAAIVERLREAIDVYTTPPESPLRRRSLTVAEITPTRCASADRLNTSSAPCGRCAKAPGCSDATAATTTPFLTPVGEGVVAAVEARRLDAGRRICHQLVLHSWRQRRRQLAALFESRERLQSQVEQLQIQVDVLQKLRESESVRRVETANENRMLKLRIDDLIHKTTELDNIIIGLRHEQETFKDIINNLHVELMNERGVNQSIANQRNAYEQALLHEKQQTAILRNESHQLIMRLEEYEASASAHKNTCLQYENAIGNTEQKLYMSEARVAELCLQCQSIEQMNDQIRLDKFELEDLLKSCRSKHDKMEAKLQEIKLLLAASREQQKLTEGDNDELRDELNRTRHEFQAQRDRQWWLKTGEFLFQKFAIAAHMVFPAISRIPTEAELKQLTFLQGSIALGTL